MEQHHNTAGNGLPTYGGEPRHSGDVDKGRQLSFSAVDPEMVQTNQLHQALKGRHMQMIAIGGAIGSGLFIGSGGAFQTGGPASVLIGFSAIGVMIYFMMQALAELAVMYPVNGAFTMYICRFVDPSWGWACGVEYAISWLTILPFEITAACNIIHFWPGSEGISDAAWITPLLVALVVIQYFGVRGYGEVEFVLSMMKVAACLGFIVLGIVINVGGVPTDDRGYIGNRYFKEPYTQAGFLNGFHGFCGVFVTAAFSYTGTELVGLAAAETANPKKEIPRAANQVVFRIGLFYILNLALVGLCVPANAPQYEGASSSHGSPFVIAIQLAKIPHLPGLFNAIILIAVMSVANSSTFGSTRTLQAMAANRMMPKQAAYVDKKGRPVTVIILQLLLGLLAYVQLAPDGGTIFDWLLALSGITVLFVFGSIALAHIRFRAAWKHHGHSVDDLPYKASSGVWGSWICLAINVIALVASFYTALYPVGGPYLGAETFFISFLAGPLIVFLYFVWKIYSWFKFPAHRPLWVAIKDIDVYTGMREGTLPVSGGVDVTHHEEYVTEKKPKGVVGHLRAGMNSLF